MWNKLNSYCIAIIEKLLFYFGGFIVVSVDRAIIDHS